MLESNLVGPPLLVASAIALGVLLLIILGSTMASREIRRRRLEREARLEEERERARQKALLDAEGEPAVNLVIDKSERDELLENARMLARENPDKTAKLLRHWLLKDEQ